MKNKSPVLVEQDRRDLEVVLAFDQFPESKTAKNIAEWLRLGHVKGGLKAEYILCHATDGASNAVGLAAAFSAGVGENRPTAIRTYVCLAHQINRSARYASGMGDFRVNQNEDLSDVWRKMHEINGRVYRNETRLKVLFQVQKDKNRYVCVSLFFVFNVNLCPNSFSVCFCLS